MLRIDNRKKQMPSLHIEHLENFITEVVDDFDGTLLSSLTHGNPFHILHPFKINILRGQSCITVDEDGDPCPPAGILPVSGERMKNASEPWERRSREGSGTGRTRED
jgi:hypothetical protein